MSQDIIFAYILNSVTDGQVRFADIVLDVLSALSIKHDKELSSSEQEIKKYVSCLIRKECLEVKYWNTDKQIYEKGSQELFTDQLSYIFLTEKGRRHLDMLWNQDLDRLWRA